MWQHCPRATHTDPRRPLQSAPGVGSGDAGGADAPLPLSIKIAGRKKRHSIANEVPSVPLHQAAAQQSIGPPWDDSLRPKAESNLGAGFIGRNGRTTFRPRSRQKVRPDMGRFRPVGSGAAGGAGVLGRRAWDRFRPPRTQSLGMISAGRPAQHQGRPKA